MIDDDQRPLRLTRDEQVQRAKDVARQMLNNGETEELERLFSFADREWPFDYSLKMIFFEEIHTALTEQRLARYS